MCVVALTGYAAADQNSLLAKAEQNPVIKAELLQKHELYAEQVSRLLFPGCGE
jgi:hypothetical protein